VEKTAGSPAARVLVVDDDVDVRHRLRRALVEAGRFEVVGEASDGDEAVSAAASLQPDVVLMDLNMPGVDGLTALPRVREVCPERSVIVTMSSTPPRGQPPSPFLVKDPSFRRLVTDLLDLTNDALPSSDDGRHAVTLSLPAELTSSSLARRRLRECLRSWGVPELVDEAQLLTTELVNNAVLHARSRVRVSIRLLPGTLRVAVSDGGAGTPHRPKPDLEATSGRGLLLVDALSSAWGTAVNGIAKTLWFELPTAHEAAAI
jgi:CheY-like chemotaxis protein/anti-sigma regulatory factor (Ser/Thr protein kinase)